MTRSGKLDAVSCEGIKQVTVVKTMPGEEDRRQNRGPGVYSEMPSET